MLVNHFQLFRNSELITVFLLSLTGADPASFSARAEL